MSATKLRLVETMDGISILVQLHRSEMGSGFWIDTDPRSTSPAKYRGSGRSNVTDAFMAIFSESKDVSFIDELLSFGLDLFDH